LTAQWQVVKLEERNYSGGYASIQTTEKGDRTMSRAIAGTVLAAWLGSLVHAQSAADAKPAEAKLEFEVASIKPSALPGGGGNGVIRLGQKGGPGSGDPGRVTYTFTTILNLMADAYSVKSYQVSGGPKWLNSEQFDIVAKVPEGATKEQVQVMLQNLLAERFKLTLHRETKELPVYALVVGTKGPKLRDSTVTDTPPASDSQRKEGGRGEAGAQAAAPPPPLPPSLRGMKIAPDGCPEIPPVAAGRAGNFMVMTPKGECMISNGQTMDALATQLSNHFDRPVIDQTGLRGKYDLRLRYDPSSMPGGRSGPVMIKDGPGRGPADGDPANRIAPDGEPPPTIFNALQEQLGLKLEARKGPVDLLVIDHVEKTPTRN
jgi:uncharacterized protein (TIGR03435 family)